MTLSRRRVLAAIAAAGGAGALTGSGAGAFLRDDAVTYGRLTTGLVDIVVDYWQDVHADPVDLATPDGRADGPRLHVPIGNVEDNTGGATLLRISLPPDRGINNPASVWLRTACPAPTTLGEFLSVELSYSDADASPGKQLVSGSLREVADALRTGIRLDGDPATPAVDCLDDDLFVVVDYSLDGYVGAETVSLPLFVVATQCRNADPDANPFPAGVVDESCEPGYACDCCWAIGNVDVENRFEAGTTYPFTEGLAGYALDVTAVDGDSGVAFDLVATDGGPVFPLCAVLVKGGPPSVTYERTDGEFGFDTGVLDGSDDGLIYAPDNPNSGARYGISHVLVRVCAPRLPDGTCPVDVAQTSASGGGPPSRPAGRNGGGQQ